MRLVSNPPASIATRGRRRAPGALVAMLVVALLALGALALQPGVADAQRVGKVRVFEGRVVAVVRANKVFVQRRPRGRVRIRVVRRTRFQDLRGLGRLRKGMRVQTRARYNGTRWVARVVDRDQLSDSDTDSDTDRDTDADSDSD